MVCCTSGFSLTGDLIQPGSGPIINVEMVGESGGNEFSSELCFADYVLSNPQAEEYYSFAACETMYMPFEEPTPPLVLNTTPSDDDDSLR